jgi:hypothetical protein
VANAFFELQRLRDGLVSKGLDTSTINNLVDKAQQEIHAATVRLGGQALDKAVEAGVAKDSLEFINELRLDAINFEVTTTSGNMEFTTPPYPQLQNLLKNAKPIKDGSGVYKVIPIGKQGNNKPLLSTNIDDAQKKVAAQRAENAKRQYARMSPAGSKQEYRTATSKQDPNSQWVKPAKTKDFGEEMASINGELKESLDGVIRDIINGYLDMY